METTPTREVCDTFLAKFLFFFLFLIFFVYILPSASNCNAIEEVCNSQFDILNLAFPEQQIEIMY